MKKTMLLTMLALSLALTNTAFAQTVKSFDKFNNTTHFTTGVVLAGKVSMTLDDQDLSLLIIQDGVGVDVGFSCGGRVYMCTPAAVELLFVVRTTSRLFQNARTVRFLIDGNPVYAGKAEWDGTVMDADDLRETLDMNISPELLARLAKAKVVEVQTGIFQFSLTEKNFLALQDIATYLSTNKPVKKMLPSIVAPPH
jgi:hypothetical protein